MRVINIQIGIPTLSIEKRHFLATSRCICIQVEHRSKGTKVFHLEFLYAERSMDFFLCFIVLQYILQIGDRQGFSSEVFFFRNLELLCTKMTLTNTIRNEKNRSHGSPFPHTFRFTDRVEKDSWPIFSFVSTYFFFSLSTIYTQIYIYVVNFVDFEYE